MIRTLVALIAALLVIPASASAARPPSVTPSSASPCPARSRTRCGPSTCTCGTRPTPPRSLTAAPTVYRSALYGDTRIPAGWKPLSWSARTPRLAREAAISQQGKAFPVIVFSTGNQNDPIDYAYTLELIAAGGFVVAAPYHANNTGDDVRIDFINEQARQLGRRG